MFHFYMSPNSFVLCDMTALKPLMSSHCNKEAKKILLRGKYLKRFVTFRSSNCREFLRNSRGKKSRRFVIRSGHQTKTIGGRTTWICSDFSNALHALVCIERCCVSSDAEKKKTDRPTEYRRFKNKIQQTRKYFTHLTIFWRRKSKTKYKLSVQQSFCPKWCHTL